MSISVIEGTAIEILAKDKLAKRQSERCSSDFPAIWRDSLTTLQVNLGYRCNQSCVHCHVNASPYRKEQMSSRIVNDVLETIRLLPISHVDLTGGAPELHPEFNRIVHEASAHGAKVIDRCNLTVLLEPGQERTAAFLAEEKVQIVASLPCYLEQNVERQRGKGIFQKSVRALKLLNELGYGSDPDLELNLVFNPQGATLPPPQMELEQQYKQELLKRFGIVFDHLFTLANMPINRFEAILRAHDDYESYLGLLKSSHQNANLRTVMCRNTISVDWQGILYDCDFNQMLDMPIDSHGRPMNLRDLWDSVSLQGNRICTADHCFGCTAGQGSSCGGALVA